MADISSASVHDVVSSTRVLPPNVASSIACARFVNGPSPEMWPLSMAWRTYSSSRPSTEALLKGIAALTP